MAADFRIGAVFDIVDRSQRQFESFLGNIRRLRLEFLGLEMAALVLNRVGKSFANMGQQILRTVTRVAGPAVEFDDSVTRLAAVSGFTGDRIAGLSDSFLELSSTLPLSAQQLAEVGIEAVKAGVKSQKAIEQVSLAASKLAAVSSDLSEAQAAKGIIAISTQFGVSAEEMENNALRLADAFATFKDAGIGTAGELANITKRFGAQARAIGLTQEQAIGLAATTRALGIQTEVAGTSLSQLIIKLSSETDRFAQAAGVQGKELKELLDKKDGLGGMAALQKVLIGLNEKAGGSTTKLAASLKSLGIRGARPVSVLLGLAQNMDTFNRIMGLTNETSGKLNEQFDLFSKSFKKQIDTLRGSIQNVAISFGQVLKPVVAGAIQVVLPLLELLTKLPAPLKLLIGLTAILAGGFLVVGGTLAVTAASVAGAAISFIFLNKVVASFRKTLARKLMPELKNYKKALFEQMIKPNAKAAASFAPIGKFLPKFIAGPLEGMFLSLSNLTGLFAGGGGVTAGLAGLKATLGGILLPFIKIVGIILAVVAVLAALRKDIEAVGSAIGELLSPFGDLIRGFGEIIGGEGNVSLLSTFLTILRIALFKLVIGFQVFAASIRFVAAIFKGIVNNILAGLMPLRETFDRIRLVVANVMEFFTVLGERFGLVSKEAGFMATVFAFLEKVFTALFKPLGIMLRILVFFVDKVIAAVVGVIEGILREMAPVFEDLAVIFDEIKSVFADIGEAFMPLFDAFGELAEALGFSSDQFDGFGITVQVFAALTRLALQVIIVPLRILTNIIKGLVFLFSGLVKLLVVPFRLLSKAMAKVIKSFSVFFRGISKGQQFATKLSDTFKFFFEDLGEAFSSIGKAIISPFKIAADAIKSVFDSIFSAIKIAFSALMNALLLPLTSLINSLNLVIRGINKANLASGLTGELAEIPVPSFDRGGITRSGGLAQLKRDEVVMPLKTVPELVSKIPPQSAAISEPRRAPAAAATAEGGDVNLEITVPVTLMLDGMVLGRAMVKVGNEEIRRQFGTKGIRLSGV